MADAIGRAPAAGARALRVWLPRPIRVALGRVRAEGVAAQTRRELGRLARSGRPIILGPWLGEVGFELLYWAPFLAWFAQEYGVAADRLIAVSRGGSAAWYRGSAARYYDVFDFMAPDEFRRRNEQRAAELGEQKQAAPTAFDTELTAAVEARAGERCERLHPATMYRLMAPFWWGHVGLSWVTRHVRYTQLRLPEGPAPDLSLAPLLPDRFVAVKFYFNDCFPPTEENRTFARDMVRTLSRTTPVVSLSTGLTLDDHTGVDDASDPLVAPRRFEARTNLEEQTRIVAAATRFVGTYGGFAYLAPLCGVAADTYYSRPGAFSRRHLDVARTALRELGTPGLLEVNPTPAAKERGGP